MTNLSHGKLGNDADQYAVYGEDGRTVAVTYDDTDGRLAGLFAAAPELLSSLIDCLDIVQFEYDNDPEPEDLTSWNRAIRAARSAIQKVKGDDNA